MSDMVIKYLSDILNVPFILTQAPDETGFKIELPKTFNPDREIVYKGMKFDYDFDNKKLIPTTDKYIDVKSVTVDVNEDGLFTGNISVNMYKSDDTIAPAVEYKLVDDNDNAVFGKSVMSIGSNIVKIGKWEPNKHYKLYVKVRFGDYEDEWRGPFEITTPNVTINAPIIDLLNSHNESIDLTNAPTLFTIKISGFGTVGTDETLDHTVVNIVDKDGNVFLSKTLESGVDSLNVSGLSPSTEYTISAQFFTASYSSPVSTVDIKTMDKTPVPELDKTSLNVTEYEEVKITITNYNTGYTYRVVGIDNYDIDSNGVITFKAPSVDTDTSMTISVIAEDKVNGLPESDPANVILNITSIPSVADDSLIVTPNISDLKTYLKDGYNLTPYGIGLKDNMDVMDKTKTSTTTKIYLNNKLIDVQPGDTLKADNGELFIVRVVNEEGEVVQELVSKTVACGWRHTFIVTSDGKLMGTGYNRYGQLGLGGTSNRNTFTDTGIRDPKMVACGGNHTFIITSDGKLMGTGYNGSGQLGLGNTKNQTSFTDTGIRDPKMVVCGGYHTFIITSDGKLMGTGENGSGQLGLGDTTDRHTFTDTGIRDPKTVVCGDNHTFIITSDGKLMGTGCNGYGQLGLGDTTDRHTFTDTGIRDPRTVVCGGLHTFIVTSDGKLMATGENDNGELGLTDTTDRYAFTDTNQDIKQPIIRVYNTEYSVTPETELTTVPNAVYPIRTKLALPTIYQGADETPWIEIKNPVINGYLNNRLLPDSTTTSIRIKNYGDVKPGMKLVSENGELFTVQVVNEEGEVIQEIESKMVACGDHFIYLVTSDGKLLVTGDNQYGQLGLGDNENRNTFSDTGIRDPKMIEPGNMQAYIVTSDGRLLATGNNDYGQLGLGDTTSRNTFSDTGIRDPKMVASRGASVYVVTSDGKLLVAGRNYEGQLGLGDTTERHTFTDTGIRDPKVVEPGGAFVHIVTSDGKLMAAGRNNFGQLGLGDTTNRNTFTDTGIRDPKMVKNGWEFSYIVTSDGKLMATGNNQYGQLGLGHTDNVSEFTDTGMRDPRLIGTGDGHVLIVTSDGKLMATGNNQYGQLGLGHTDNVSEFTDTGMRDVKFVDCGADYSVIIGPDGKLLATGGNYYGQLGLGDNNNRQSFTDTSISESDIASIGTYKISVKYAEVTLNKTIDTLPNLLAEPIGLTVNGVDVAPTLVSDCSEKLLDTEIEPSKELNISFAISHSQYITKFVADLYKKEGS